VIERDDIEADGAGVIVDRQACAAGASGARGV
jgi:hypothetical protein